MMERRTFADREDVLGAVMLAPALAYVIVLVGVPFVLAIVLSFSNATAGSLSFGWAGLGNYAAILGDPIFLRALRNSAVVTVGTQLLVVILATPPPRCFAQRSGGSVSPDSCSSCLGPCRCRSQRSHGRGSSIRPSA